MADIKMPPSIPCKFNTGWSKCGRPTTDGLCSEHAKMHCAVCKAPAVRLCDAQMGGLACGVPLCGNCCHSTESSAHVTKDVYAVEARDAKMLAATGRESKRLLALRGVRTDVELPRHLEDIFKEKRGDFVPMACHHLHLSHGCMGEFPALIGKTKIVVITPDRDSIIRVWRSLEPRESAMVTQSWLVNPSLEVGYRVPEDTSEYIESRPQRISFKEDIDRLFAERAAPFAWARGLWGGDIDQAEFARLIARAIATPASAAR